MSKLYDLSEGKATSITTAAKSLAAGKVIVLPFEGTYIFAAAAKSVAGAGALRAVDSEVADKSVQLLTVSLESISDFADTSGSNLPGLVAKNWPGPLAIRLALSPQAPGELAHKPRVKKVEVVTTRNDFTRKVIDKAGPLVIRRATFGGKLPTGEALELLVTATPVYSSGTIRKSPEITIVEVVKNKVTTIEPGSIPAKNIDVESVDIAKIVRKNEKAIRSAIDDAKRIEEEKALIHAEGAEKIAQVKAEIEAKVAHFEELQATTTSALREVERLNSEVSDHHTSISKAMASLTSTLEETLQRSESLNIQESNFANELEQVSREKLAEIEAALSAVAGAHELHQNLRESLKEGEAGALKVAAIKAEIAELVAKLSTEREARFAREEENNVAREAKLAAATKAYQGLFASGQSDLASLKKEISELATEIKVSSAELAENKANLRAEVSLDIQALHEARMTVESAATVELEKIIALTTAHSAKLERNFKRLDGEHQAVKDLIASEVAKLDAVRSRSENDLALFEGARREFRVAIEEILKAGKKDIKAQREQTAAELTVALDEFVVGADKYLHQSESEFAKFLHQVEASTADILRESEKDLARSVDSARDTISEALEKSEDRLAEFVARAENRAEAAILRLENQVTNSLASAEVALEDASLRHAEEVKKLAQENDSLVHALVSEAEAKVASLITESNESIALLNEESSKRLAGVVAETESTVGGLIATNTEAIATHAAEAKKQVAEIKKQVAEVKREVSESLAESSRIASETRQYLAQSLESTTDSLDRLVKSAENQLASLQRQAETLTDEVRKSDELLQVDSSDIAALKKSVAAEIARLESIIDKAQDLKSQEATDLTKIERALENLEDRPAIDEGTVHDIVAREISQASAVWERMLEQLQLSPETIAALQELNSVSELGTERRSRSARRIALKGNKLLTGSIAAGLIAAVGATLFFTGTFSSSNSGVNKNDLLYCYDKTQQALIGVNQSEGCAPGQLSLGIGPIHYPTVRPAELNQFVANRFYAAQQRAKAEGINIAITSGWRSLALQEKLFQKAIVDHGSPAQAEQWVLPPNVSAHPWGIAIDVNYPGDQNGDSWLERNGWRYGLCRVYTNEYWHFEPTVGPGESCPVKLKNATDALAVAD